MKKIFLLTIVIFALNASTTFATNVPAGLVSGTWTLAGSPYNIQGSIQIPNDSTLIIEPGVSVIFMGAYKLNVQGRLLAVGNITDTITFTAVNTTVGWKGIRFDNTPSTNDTSKIMYCKIQYGKPTGTYSDINGCGGALFFNYFSKAVISNSNISYNISGSGGAIFCESSSPAILNNSILNNICDYSIHCTLAYIGGGGIYSSFGNPIISNNTISYNSSNLDGGGIYCLFGNPNISSNIISNNTASNNGGGFSCTADGVISHNSISFNTSGNKGGGVFCSSSGTINNFIFTQNLISNNTAVNGGGFYCGSSSNTPSIFGNIISNNSASGNGGGLYCTNNSPIFTNFTITNNSAVNGGALYCELSSSPVFRNCIIYGNNASSGGSQVFLNDDTSDPAFNYCDVQGGSASFELNGNFYTGTYQNNINADPLFVSPSGGSGSGYNGLTADWSLQNTSPCIDAGDPNGVYPTNDIAGNPRVTVCRIDMGAYEYQTGIPFTVSLSISQPIICNGVPTGEITASVSGGTLPYTYLWSNGQTTDTAIGLIAGTYTVTVSTASYGCVIIDTITLNAPVTISVDAGSDLAFICGDSAQLGCIVSPSGTPTLTYQWSPSIGLNYDTIPNPKALVTGNIKYIVTVTTPNGCIAIDSVNITSSLSITGNDNTVNCGASTIILNTTTNYTGTDTLTYLWLPVAGLDNPNIANPIATIDSNQTYIVTVTTLNGCSATDDISISIIPMNAPEICIVGVDSSNKNRIVWNKPLSAAIDSFYIYRETNITNHYQKIGVVSYDSLSVFVDNNSDPNVQSNKYKISIKDKCGLESDTSATHKTMLLSINQGMGNTWNLIWEAYEGFTVSTYNVYRGSTPNNLQLIGTSSGSNTHYNDLTAPSGYLYYQVEVVSPNSCNPAKSYNSSRSNIASNNPNGIANTSIRSNLFSIYPNPANNEIEISVPQKSFTSAISIEILNTTGQVLKSMNINNNHAKIDISGFASGMYFIKVIPIAIGTDAGIAVKKFVKE